MKKLTVTEYLALSSDERFVEMCNATIAALRDPDDFNEFYGDTKNRWIDLATVWDVEMEYALHYIYWGVYPRNCKTPEERCLCSLVAAELLDYGEAFEAWSRWSVFEEMLEGMVDEVCSDGTGIETHFIEHHNYLSARLLCKVKYEKTRPDGFGAYVRQYESYEKIVARFIPEAKNWTRDRWGNDLNVAAALEDRYGVDYVASSASEDDFDRIIMMCRELEYWGDTADVVWYAANIEQFPLDMVKVLWPSDLEGNVTKLFLAAYKATVRYEESGQLCLDKKNKYYHPVGHFEREALRASWLYQNVSEWYMAGKYSGQQEKDVKTVLFDLEMTC